MSAVTQQGDDGNCMEERARFAGHRLVRFAPETRATLAEVAERLIPQQQKILDGWISEQFTTWEPPGFTRESLGKMFSELLGGILDCMRTGELEACVESLENSGSSLAALQFPFDALVISVHFLEESYMPLLLDPTPPDARRWLVTMDEFLHVALSALANAYFEAYRRELLDEAEIGHIVQEALAPRIPKRMSDLEVAHAYISARDKARLGGDFLDIFTMDYGHLAFVIGDLSGHGLDAAADSVMLRSLFRGFMREQPDLTSAMRRLDRVLYSELKTGQFVTALAGVYRDQGRIDLMNCGHPFPVLCNDECTLISAHGGALGIGVALPHSVDRVKLKPGGVFVAYTDGLTEAGSRRDMFGDERVREIVASMREAPPRAIVDQLLDDARRHAGGRLTDDVAVLAIRRKE